MATPLDLNAAFNGAPAFDPSAAASIGGETGLAGMGSLLEQMTGQIQARIAEVERRHAGALRDMQAKLARMSGDAVRARPDMPAELATAFSRIEAGMADLVERIADTVPERRRGAVAFVFGTQKPDHTHFVFNPPARKPVAPISLDGTTAAEPWDAAAAEALAHLYESGEGLLGKHLPEAALFAPAHRAKAATTAPQAPLPTPKAEQPSPVAAPLTPAGLGHDRDWVDQRFTSLADHVAKTVRNASPDGALDRLMSRVDQLEQRFTSALDALADRPATTAHDPDALAQVEAHLEDLSRHVQQTHQQLSRLDAIEQHLSDLNAFAHASVDADTAHADSAPHGTGTTSAAASHDFAQLADLAVERALARAPAAPTTAPSETQARVDAVHTLLQDFAVERRRGDQYTTGMLETVQEALIRLIDRVDAIDAATQHAHTDAARETVAHAASHHAAVEPPQAVRSRAATPPAVDAAAAPRARMPRAPEVTPDVAPAVAPERAPALDELAVNTDEIEAHRPVRTEINIKELRLKTDRSKAPNHDATDAPVDTAPQSAAPQSAAPRARRMPVTAASSSGSASKRGVALAALALSLGGISYVAHLMYSDQSPSTAAVSAAAPAVPARPDIRREAPAASATPAAVRPATAPATAAVVAPVAAPPIAAPAVVPAVIPAAAPAAIPVPAQASTATVPPGMVAPMQRPGGGPQPGTLRPEPATAKRSDAPTADTPSARPASVPETISDDLSMADVDDDGLPISRAATTVAQLSPVPAPRSLSMPVALPASQDAAQRLAAQRLAAVDGAQRQANMASVSERLGAQARSASDFSQRFGAAPAPAPALAPAAAPVATLPVSPIATSSTQPVRATLPADAGNPDAVPATAELPPAQIGPLSLRMAASQGDPSAALEVATRFAEGRGIKQDFKSAMIWYQRSAAKGFAVAQYRLGALYERGIGTPVDLVRAKLWYKRAADQGNVKAMHNMAVLSAGNGQGDPDYAAAAKWFKDAAERGLADSQFNLGVLNESGLGIAKDPRQAYIWFSLAARSGDAEAVRRRDALLATLDATSLKSGDDAVRSWRSRATDMKVNDARVAGDLWRNHAFQLDVPPQPQSPPQPMAAAAEQPATPTAPTPRVIRVPATQR